MQAEHKCHHLRLCPLLPAAMAGPWGKILKWSRGVSEGLKAAARTSALL